jgi:hypothetical protein
MRSVPTSSASWARLVVTEAATLPVDGFGDTAFVCAVDDFLEAGDDVGVAMFAQFDLYPAATYFVGDCACGAGTCEGIEGNIARVGCKFENTLN